MASLQGLPPLPKSLRGLLNFSSAQWKELERIHAMRTMIQQDLNRSQPGSGAASGRESPGGPGPGFSSADSPVLQKSQPQSPNSGRLRKNSSLDSQLALLRREMVGLRQLDMSLLCQLWSLNESIHEFKQMVQEGKNPNSPSPGWDNGVDTSSCDECDSMPVHCNTVPRERRRSRSRSLNAVPEHSSMSSSTSDSSLEF